MQYTTKGKITKFFLTGGLRRDPAGKIILRTGFYAGSGCKRVSFFAPPGKKRANDLDPGEAERKNPRLLCAAKRT
jgi:hypothetical protein